jgi:hypothetical protein
MSGVNGEAAANEWAYEAYQDELERLARFLGRITPITDEAA